MRIDTCAFQEPMERARGSFVALVEVIQPGVNISALLGMYALEI